VVELFAEWLPDEGAVFPSRSGGALSPRQAQARLASWCRRGGIRRVSPHALRHSFAQELLRRTGDLAVVQRALTHRSITSTVVYARADEGAVRAALG
jgi:site-specific recombinase XerC